MISVILPAYNEEQLLARCLTSLLNQDCTDDYEVIVVDNASTDGTRAIAHEFGVRVISCAERGAFPARQAGARAARGEILVQADADTVYPADWLSRLAAHFARRPNLVALGGRFLYIDPPPAWAPLEYGLRRFLNALGKILLGRPVVVSGANFAFRRDAFRQIGGYRVHAFSADQYDISARLSTVGRVGLDNRIQVWTSPRRVGKPLLAIVGDFLANTRVITSHFLRPPVAAMTVKVRTRRALRTSVTLLPAVVLVSYFAYGYYVPDSQVFGKVYYQGDARTGAIALTFDDGPNEPYTSQVLAVLQRYGAKGTFFLIGKNVATYPAVARRIVTEGHAIGNHTYAHNANHAVTSGTCGEILMAEQTIQSITGLQPHLYRPPHGKKSPWELHCLRDHGLVEVTWAVSTEDQHVTSPAALADSIIRAARPGSIILMHDGYGTQHGTAHADRSFTVEALPLIIEALQRKGYRFVTVSDLLGVPAYK
jgi:peptidoglycan-N-acetylglucosamine deacetylase